MSDSESLKGRGECSDDVFAKNEMMTLPSWSSAEAKEPNDLQTESAKTQDTVVKTNRVHGQPHGASEAPHNIGQPSAHGPTSGGEAVMTAAARSSNAATSSSRNSAEEPTAAAVRRGTKLKPKTKDAKHHGAPTQERASSSSSSTSTSSSVSTRRRRRQKAKRARMAKEENMFFKSSGESSSTSRSDSSSEAGGTRGATSPQGTTTSPQPTVEAAKTSPHEESHPCDPKEDNAAEQAVPPSSSLSSPPTHQSSTTAEVGSLPCETAKGTLSGTSSYSSHPTSANSFTSERRKEFLFPTKPADHGGSCSESPSAGFLPSSPLGKEPQEEQRDNRVEQPSEKERQQPLLASPPPRGAPPLAPSPTPVSTPLTRLRAQDTPPRTSGADEEVTYSLHSSVRPPSEKSGAGDEQSESTAVCGQDTSRTTEGGDGSPATAVTGVAVEQLRGSRKSRKGDPASEPGYSLIPSDRTSPPSSSRITSGQQSSCSISALATANGSTTLPTAAAATFREDSRGRDHQPPSVQSIDPPRHHGHHRKRSLTGCTGKAGVHSDGSARASPQPPSSSHHGSRHSNDHGHHSRPHGSGTGTAATATTSTTLKTSGKRSGKKNKAPSLMASRHNSGDDEYDESEEVLVGNRPTTAGLRSRLHSRRGSPVAERKLGTTEGGGGAFGHATVARSAIATKDLDDCSYLDRFGLVDVLSRLALALLRSKPEDHVAFTRAWLRSEMKATIQNNQQQRAINSAMNTDRMGANNHEAANDLRRIASSPHFSNLAATAQAAAAAAAPSGSTTAAAALDATPAAASTNTDTATAVAAVIASRDIALLVSPPITKADSASIAPTTLPSAAAPASAPPISTLEMAELMSLGIASNVEGAAAAPTTAATSGGLTVISTKDNKSTNLSRPALPTSQSSPSLLTKLPTPGQMAHMTSAAHIIHASAQHQKAGKTAAEALTGGPLGLMRSAPAQEVTLHSPSASTVTGTSSMPADSEKRGGASSSKSNSSGNNSSAAATLAAVESAPTGLNAVVVATQEREAAAIARAAASTDDMRSTAVTTGGAGTTEGRGVEEVSSGPSSGASPTEQPSVLSSPASNGVVTPSGAVPAVVDLADLSIAAVLKGAATSAMASGAGGGGSAAGGDGSGGSVATTATAAATATATAHGRHPRREKKPEEKEAFITIPHAQNKFADPNLVTGGGGGGGAALTDHDVSTSVSLLPTSSTPDMNENGFPLSLSSRLGKKAKKTGDRNITNGEMKVYLDSVCDSTGARVVDGRPRLASGLVPPSEDPALEGLVEGSDASLRAAGTATWSKRLSNENITTNASPHDLEKTRPFFPLNPQDPTEASPSPGNHERPPSHGGDPEQTAAGKPAGGAELSGEAKAAADGSDSDDYGLAIFSPVITVDGATASRDFSTAGGVAEVMGHVSTRSTMMSPPGFGIGGGGYGSSAIGAPGGGPGTTGATTTSGALGGNGGGGGRKGYYPSNPVSVPLGPGATAAAATGVPYAGGPAGGNTNPMGSSTTGHKPSTSSVIPSALLAAAAPNATANAAASRARREAAAANKLSHYPAHSGGGVLGATPTSASTAGAQQQQQQQQQQQSMQGAMGPMGNMAGNDVSPAASRNGSFAHGHAFPSGRSRINLHALASAGVGSPSVMGPGSATGTAAAGGGLSGAPSLPLHGTTTTGPTEPNTSESTSPTTIPHVNANGSGIEGAAPSGALSFAQLSSGMDSNASGTGAGATPAANTALLHNSSNGAGEVVDLPLLAFPTLHATLGDKDIVRPSSVRHTPGQPKDPLDGGSRSSKGSVASVAGVGGGAGTGSGGGSGVPTPAAAFGTSPLSTAAMPSEAVRHMHALISQVPPAKYAAALVFLESLTVGSPAEVSMDNTSPASGASLLPRVVSPAPQQPSGFGHVGSNTTGLAENHPFGTSPPHSGPTMTNWEASSITGVTGGPGGAIATADRTSPEGGGRAWSAPSGAASSAAAAMPVADSAAAAASYAVGSSPGTFTSARRAESLEPYGDAGGGESFAAAPGAVNSKPSSSVEAIVRDALSQSIIMKLPADHLKGKHSSSSSTPTTGATPLTAAAAAAGGGDGANGGVGVSCGNGTSSAPASTTTTSAADVALSIGGYMQSSVKSKSGRPGSDATQQQQQQQLLAQQQKVSFHRRPATPNVSTTVSGHGKRFPTTEPREPFFSQAAIEASQQIHDVSQRLREQSASATTTSNAVPDAPAAMTTSTTGAAAKAQTSSRPSTAHNSPPRTADGAAGPDKELGDGGDKMQQYDDDPSSGEAQEDHETSKRNSPTSPLWKLVTIKPGASPNAADADVTEDPAEPAATPRNEGDVASLPHPSQQQQQSAMPLQGELPTDSESLDVSHHPSDPTMPGSRADSTHTGPASTLLDHTTDPAAHADALPLPLEGSMPSTVATTPLPPSAGSLPGSFTAASQQQPQHHLGGEGTTATTSSPQTRPALLRTPKPRPAELLFPPLDGELGSGGPGTSLTSHDIGSPEYLSSTPPFRHRHGNDGAGKSSKEAAATHEEPESGSQLLPPPQSSQQPSTQSTNMATASGHHSLTDPSPFTPFLQPRLVRTAPAHSLSANHFGDDAVAAFTDAAGVYRGSFFAAEETSLEARAVGETAAVTGRDVGVRSPSAQGGRGGDFSQCSGSRRVPMSAPQYSLTPPSLLLLPEPSRSYRRRRPHEKSLRDAGGSTASFLCPTGESASSVEAILPYGLVPQAAAGGRRSSALSLSTPPPPLAVSAVLCRHGAAPGNGSCSSSTPSTPPPPPGAPTDPTPIPTRTSSKTRAGNGYDDNDDADGATRSHVAGRSPPEEDRGGSASVASEDQQPAMSTLDSNASSGTRQQRSNARGRVASAYHAHFGEDSFHKHRRQVRQSFDVLAATTPIFHVAQADRTLHDAMAMAQAAAAEGELMDRQPRPAAANDESSPISLALNSPLTFTDEERGTTTAAGGTTTATTSVPATEPLPSAARDPSSPTVSNHQSTKANSRWEPQQQQKSGTIAERITSPLYNTHMSPFSDLPSVPMNGTDSESGPHAGPTEQLPTVTTGGRSLRAHSQQNLGIDSTDPDDAATATTYVTKGTRSLAAAMNRFLSQETKPPAAELDQLRRALASDTTVFGVLDDTQLETLVHSLSRHTYDSGDVLVHEGEASMKCLLVVLQGALAVSNSEGAVTKSLSSGECFAAAELTHPQANSTFTLTVTAPGTTLYTLSTSDYQKLVIYESEARRVMFLQYIQHVPFLRSMLASDQTRLADGFRVCEIKEGARLVEQGKPVEWLYLILSGEVECVLDPGILRESNEQFAAAAASDFGGGVNRTNTDTDTDSRGQQQQQQLLPPSSGILKGSSSALPASTLEGYGRSRGLGAHTPLIQQHQQHSQQEASSLDTASCGSPPFGLSSRQQGNRSKSTGDNPNNGRSARADPDTAKSTLKLPSLGKGGGTSAATSSGPPSRHYLSVGPPLAKGAGAASSASSMGADDPYAACSSSSSKDASSAHTAGSHADRLASQADAFTPLSPPFTPNTNVNTSQDRMTMTSPSPLLKPGRLAVSKGLMAPTSAGPADAPNLADDTAHIICVRKGCDLIGEAEFAFRCNGLLTVTAVRGPVQVARISRLHLDLILSRHTLREIKSFLVTDPAYRFFERVVPDEVKGEMRRVALYRTVAEKRSSHQRRSRRGASKSGATVVSEDDTDAKATTADGHHSSRHSCHYSTHRSIPDILSTTHRNNSERGDSHEQTPKLQQQQQLPQSLLSVPPSNLSLSPSLEAVSNRDSASRRRGQQRTSRSSPMASPFDPSGLSGHLTPKACAKKLSRRQTSLAMNAMDSATAAQRSVNGGSENNSFDVAPSQGNALELRNADTRSSRSVNVNGANNNNNNTADKKGLAAGGSSSTGAGLGATNGGRWQHISADGEIIFSGSRNLYRFPAQALKTNNSVVIAVVVDGTIIRWNPTAQRVVGYAPFEVVGQSIYDLMSNDESRQILRVMLQTAKTYAGNWEAYTSAEMDRQEVFSFRQNTGLLQIGLALSVIPSLFAASSEVFLLIGREAKYRAAASYAADVARWLNGALKPQLQHFNRSVANIEANGWQVTPEDALRLRGNLDACSSMVEQFTRFSTMNMESVSDSWRPVRLQVLLRRFLVEANSAVCSERHTFFCNVEEVTPRYEIFLDAQQVFQVLRMLLEDAVCIADFDPEVEVNIELRVVVVEPDEHPDSRLVLSPAGNRNTSPKTQNAPTAMGTTSTQYFSPLHVVPEKLPRGNSEDVGGNESPLGIRSLSHLHTALKTHTDGNSNGDTHPSETGDSGGGDAVSITTAQRQTIDLAMNSLRRVRFEMRDNGPSIESLRSPDFQDYYDDYDDNHHTSQYGKGTEDALPAPTPHAVPPPMAPFNSPVTSGAPSSFPPTAGPSVDNVAGMVSASSPTSAADGSSKAPPPLLARPHRGGELPQVEKIVTSMGGILYGFTRPEVEGNMVRVELPLLAVPGSKEKDDASLGGGGNGGEDELGGADQSNNRNPVITAGRTFTVLVADNDRTQQVNLCQLLWARQHAVVPVTSFKELMRKIEVNSADILIIDPLQLDITAEDYDNLQSDNPFDDIRDASGRMVMVVMGTDFSDWRVQKLLDRNSVIELPKLGSAVLVHIAMQEAEQMVTEMREEEERIELLRRTFTCSIAGRHKVGRLLGKGTFGDVYEVEDTLTGGKMAMKRMQLHDGVFADEVVEEILAMTRLQHENIIHYFYCEKESDTLLRLYMELAPGGTLRNKIRQNPGEGLPFDQVVQHLTDICRGLAYVHAQHYVHGDLKTANLLLGTRGRTKIGDFGTAKRLRPGQKLYTMVGTPQYMAPEVLNADAEQRIGYDFKADIWSVGCIALEMATGQPPFAHLEQTHGMGIIKYLSELTDTPDLSPLFRSNPLVFEFVKGCLDVDPNNRPSAQELFHFDILQGAVTSVRAERIVKRAEMLYKLNKYAAMRADPDDPRGFDDEEDEEVTEDDEEEDYTTSPSNSSAEMFAVPHHTHLRERRVDARRMTKQFSSSSSSVSVSGSGSGSGSSSGADDSGSDSASSSEGEEESDEGPSGTGGGRRGPNRGSAEVGSNGLANTAAATAHRLSNQQGDNPTEVANAEGKAGRPSPSSGATGMSRKEPQAVARPSTSATTTAAATSHGTAKAATGAAKPRVAGSDSDDSSMTSVDDSDSSSSDDSRGSAHHRLRPDDSDFFGSSSSSVGAVA